MRRTKLVKIDINALDGMALLIATYEEISALRMRRVKNSVLAGREFMSGLSDAFGYISYAYSKYRSSAKGRAKSNILNTNGKTVSVLISANTGLYGDIVKETFDLFMKNILNTTTDLVIVGKIGRNMLESVAPSVKFSYCNLPDALTEPQEMLELVKSLVQYSNIIIYHGLFKSILHQEPQNTFVTGEVFKIESTITEKKVGFLFEPSVEFIAEYFEKQILSVLIEQTLYEASLSKFASRMLSLDTASQNISTRMDALVLKYHKLKYKEINERIQASLSGGTLWK